MNVSESIQSRYPEETVGNERETVSNGKSRIYATEEAAAKRAEALQAAGIWPGIVRVPGGWRLTVDPDGIRPVSHHS